MIFTVFNIYNVHKVTSYTEIEFFGRIVDMQHVSSFLRPLISGNSGFNLHKHTRRIFVDSFDLKETCYSRSELQPELPQGGLRIHVA